MTGGSKELARKILDQFARQAAPFAQKAAMSSQEMLQLMVEASGAGGQDEVLDIACGPDLTACSLAGAARLLPSDPAVLKATFAADFNREISGE